VIPCPAALLPGLSAAIPTMTPKITPCISRAIPAQDETDGLPAVRFSGVENPEKADYSAGVSSSVWSWAPHGAVAALCCCTKSNAQTPVWGRTLRAPPEGDHHDARTTDHSHPPRRSPNFAALDHAVTLKAPWTGSGWREYSYGGFGGGHPHFHPAKSAAWRHRSPGTEDAC
jgi:hypothetical protein